MSVKNRQTKERLDFHFEVKKTSEDEEFFYFEGYASTYGNVDLGNDIVIKGAFDESLRTIIPELLWMHKGDQPLGIWEKDSFVSDEHGLFVRGKMPLSDSFVRDRVIPQMKIGSVRAMSIGYWAIDSERDSDGIRKILKAELWEISLVGRPMNPEAEITGLKKFSIEDVKNIRTKREVESILRESGRFTNSSIVCLASKFCEEISPKPAVEVDTKLLAELTEEFNSMR